MQNINYLNSLQAKHNKLENMIKYYNIIFQDMKVKSLKKQKLLIKDKLHDLTVENI